MATHLVTGAAGFIGSHVAEALLQQGERVIGIDSFNDYYDAALKRQNVAALQSHAAFELIAGEIQTLDWPALLAQSSTVFHQAAQAGVRASWGQGFGDYTERNINATQCMLEAAKHASGLQRFVFASTSSVYGNAETLPTPESVCPQPISPYGITKLAAEQLCWLYWQNFGVPATALRYFTVYGPRQRPDMAFHKFFRAALAGEPIAVYGDGRQTRDFTFISDAVAANLAAAQAPEAVGQAINVGGGSRVALTEVLDAIERTVGRSLQRRYAERAMGDARHTGADVSRAHRVLGYRPQVPLESGLQQQWAWMQATYEAATG
ncbi:MAG: UDP-glucose 4-epimerase [Cyanobacteria bacterium QS_8_64_29]|nr:MAG: UDP-glucose 4-epimerase [Cyanobacteria bacterium QS_8_64_29]